MKIISKFKDYYDYISGIYGEDPLKVLDRRDFYSLLYPEKETKIYFCGEIYIKGVSENIHEDPYKKGKYFYGENGKIWRSVYKDIEILYKDSDIVWFKPIIQNKHYELKPEKDNNKPYYFLTGWKDRKGKFPILKDIQFDKIMKPQDAYLAIENYISKKDTEPDTDPNNMIRYEQKGFDTKTSFRNVKKSI